MKVIKFEDLIAWQESRLLVNKLYKITSNSHFSKDYSLRDQIRRASTSIMFNIAEGFDGGSDQQFIQFLTYSLRSCSEVQSILYVCVDNNYIENEDFKSFYEQAKKIRKLCAGLIKYLKNKTVN